MSRHQRFYARALVAAVLAVALTGAAANAQTAASIPRTPDGKPDFSGVWQVLNTAWWDLEDHAAEKGVPAGQGVVEGGSIPYQPWAAARKQENYKNRATADPNAKCYLPGVPRITYAPFPFHIFQTRTHVSMLYEYIHTSRLIYVDGSPHPDGPLEWWMGDSRARWDGDTLVVDVTHFNDQTWLDGAGNFHSEQMHVVERYSFIDKDHIRYEATIEDPKVFTRPWKVTMPLYRRIEPNVRVLEYECYAFDHWYTFVEDALRQQQR